ncbi:DUF4287 domain-containing protein [Micromonospora chalcea]
MSFQAYLDAIEDKTGKTPRGLVDQARERGYDAADVKAGVIVGWLKDEYGLGRGHAMALVHVIKNGPKISVKHVGSTGSHRRRQRHVVAGRQGRPSLRVAGVDSDAYRSAHGSDQAVAPVRPGDLLPRAARRGGGGGGVGAAPVT